MRQRLAIAGLVLVAASLAARRSPAQGVGAAEGNLPCGGGAVVGAHLTDKADAGSSAGYRHDTLLALVCAPSPAGLKHHSTARVLAGMTSTSDSRPQRAALGPRVAVDVDWLNVAGLFGSVHVGGEVPFDMDGKPGLFGDVGTAFGARLGRNARLRVGLLLSRAVGRTRDGTAGSWRAGLMLSAW